MNCGIIVFLLAVQGFCNFSERYPPRYDGLKIYENLRHIDIIAKFVPDDPIIFEAGGHYGVDTVEFANRWPQGKIITFEPNPHAFECLTQATQGMRHVSIHNLALNDYNGQAVLHLCYGESGKDVIFEGASSLLPPSYWQAMYYQGPDVVVPCVVLDDWCKEHGVDHIDFMWLDLEGLEFKVMQSSPHILDTVKVIYTETNFLEFRQGMVQFNELNAFLENKRFKLIAHWYAQGYQGNAIFIKKESFEN